MNLIYILIHIYIYIYNEEHFCRLVDVMETMEGRSIAFQNIILNLDLLDMLNVLQKIL
jgi:hypothetical protein